MLHSRNSLSLLLVGLALSSVFGGCSGGCNSPRNMEKQKHVLKVQLQSEPIFLDPALVEDGVGLKLVTQMREGLVGYDGKGALQLELAESYTLSPGGKRFEFRLKPDLKWSDGRPVTVQDFVFGIRRALHPKTGGKLSEQLMPIRGARALRAGKLSVSEGLATRSEKRGEKGILDRSVGVFEENGKLIVELEEPAPYFLQALSLPAALPVRQDILNESEGKWLENKMPGTGPYRFAAYQPGKRFLLEANPYYWGTKPAIPLIDFLFVQDESTALNLFETGKLDILTRVPTMDMPRLRKQGLIRTDPYLATYFLSFNTRKAPFQNREWRRAVAGAVSREQIVQMLDSGDASARSWIPQGLEGFISWSDPAPVFASAVSSVRAELSKSPARTFGVSFDSSARNTLILEKVQQDLLRKLGMRVTLSNLDWKSYLKSLQTQSTEIFRFGWLAPFADPINPLQVFLSKSPNNYTGWSNAEYDALVAEISRLALGPARETKIRRAQQILVDEEAIVVPLYHYAQNHLVSPRVMGFQANPFGVIPFRELSLRLEGGAASR